MSLSKTIGEATPILHLIKKVPHAVVWHFLFFIYQPLSAPAWARLTAGTVMVPKIIPRRFSGRVNTGS
jgi:hypothetical protein